MSLRDKYSAAVQTAKRIRMDGSAEERDGKLHFNGTVNSDDEKNEIWNALKTVPDWQKDVVADIQVRQTTSAPAGQQSSEGTEETYTVKAGDTLSSIAKRLLGDSNDYMEIFTANRDQLRDPDQIKPGQVLRIPQRAH